MFPYWTFIKYGIPLLIGLIIGGFVISKIDNITINKLKKENAAYETVNKTNQETIFTLQDRLSKEQETCNTRLKNKDNTINKLKKVDNLKPGEINEKDTDDPSTILGTLNGLWPKDSK